VQCSYARNVSARDPFSCFSSSSIFLLTIFVRSFFTAQLFVVVVERSEQCSIRRLPLDIWKKISRFFLFFVYSTYRRLVKSFCLIIHSSWWNDLVVPILLLFNYKILDNRDFFKSMFKRFFNNISFWSHHEKKRRQLPWKLEKRYEIYLGNVALIFPGGLSIPRLFYRKYVMRRTAIEASCLRQACKTRDACVSFHCMLQTSWNEVIKLRKLERHATEYITCSVMAIKILGKTLFSVLSCSTQLLKSAREDTNTRQMVNQRN